MGAATEQGLTSLGYDIKILMEVGVYFGKEVQSNIFCDETESLVCY